MAQWFIKILDFFFLEAVLYFGILLLGSYLLLLIFAGISINRNFFFGKLRRKDDLMRMPNAPGISIITSAFNESPTIIENVKSLLNLQYPKFEVVIVNDGSKDDTLEKMMKYFELVKVDYYFEQKIHHQPIRGIYKSTNKAHKHLIVVDKFNGGAKADAMNAGLNVSNFPYFLNTDVDCVLESETLLYFMSDILSDRSRVIAIGATLRMSNSFLFKNGILKEIRLPKNIWVRFQELEYVRSYLLGKMGWSYVNAVPNVSGGLGVFEKKVVMDVGGYKVSSLGEDMELIIDVSRMLNERKEPFKIKYLPQVLCYTEGPDSIKVLSRQRVRWARGLWQIYKNNMRVLFNPKYKRLGLIVFPYNFFFELLAPIIEFLGLLFMIYYAIITQRGELMWYYFLLVYLFSAILSTTAVLYNQILHNYYQKTSDVYKLVLITFLEPLLYHPIVVYSALKGYYNEIFKKKHVWGDMQRKGFQNINSNEAQN